MGKWLPGIACVVASPLCLWAQPEFCKAAEDGRQGLWDWSCSLGSAARRCEAAPGGMSHRRMDAAKPAGHLKSQCCHWWKTGRQTAARQAREDKEGSDWWEMFVGQSKKRPTGWAYVFFFKLHKIYYFTEKRRLKTKCEWHLGLWSHSAKTKSITPESILNKMFQTAFLVSTKFELLPVCSSSQQDLSKPVIEKSFSLQLYKTSMDSKNDWHKMIKDFLVLRTFLRTWIELSSAKTQWTMVVAKTVFLVATLG